MKKFFTSLSILALIATSSVFVSCSSDDNSSKEVEVIQQDPLLAKWTAKEIDLRLQLGDNVMADEVGTDITNDLELYFEFEEDNVAHLFQKDLETGNIIEATGTYSISGSELTTLFNGVSQIFEYEINGNKLLLTLNTEEMYQGEVLTMNMTYHLYK